MLCYTDENIAFSWDLFVITSYSIHYTKLYDVIVITVCIAAALYEESWRFDRSKRIIISKTGIIFLHKTKTWSFAEIANFELMVFLRGAESDGIV